MHEYIEVNKEAYNFLANEYFENLMKHDNYYRHVSEKICEFIFKEASFLEKTNNNKLNILELGCGVGGILKVLKKYSNINIYAIDFSENMISFARQSNNSVHIENINILDVSTIENLFKEKISKKIDIIIMAAFIHLFPMQDAEIIMKNIRNWLSPKNAIYIDTTDEKEFKDGQLSNKRSKMKAIKYFRTFWTKEKFNIFLNNCGYKIIAQRDHVSNDNKTWMRTVIIAE